MLILAWALYGALLGVAAAATHSMGWWRRPTDPPAQRTAHWLAPTTAAAAALLGLSHLTPTAHIAWALALVPAAAIAPVEAAVRRIPNPLTATLGVIAATALAVTAAQGRVGVAAAAAAAALVVGAFYLLGAMVRAGVGLGDVKAAPSLAALTALQSPATVVWAVALAYAATLCHALIVAARSGGGRATRVAHGPWMVAGAVLALAVHRL